MHRKASPSESHYPLASEPPSPAATYGLPSFPNSHQDLPQHEKNKATSFGQMDIVLLENGARRLWRRTCRGGKLRRPFSYGGGEAVLEEQRAADVSFYQGGSAW
ncbi:hypothetical protein ACFX2H_032968 [Malus domestica]